MAARINTQLLSQQQSDISDLKKRQSLSELVSMGIIVVFFLAFVGLVFALGTIMVDSYRAKEASYQDLANKLERQNTLLLLMASRLKLNIPTGF